MKTIAIIGSGSWGMALGIHLANIGNNVKIWSFLQEEADIINIERKCKFLPNVDKIPNNTMSVDIVVKKNTQTTSSKIDCTLPDNLTNTICLIPDFTTMTEEQVKTWKNKFSNNISIVYIESTEDGISGTIINQSIKAGTHINELNNNSIKLTIIK